MRALLLPLLALLLPWPAAAEAPPPKPRPAAGKKERPRVPDLGLGKLGAIPKGEGVQAAQAADLGPGVKDVGAAAARYEVVDVEHAAAFVLAPGGSHPRGPLLRQVALRERPARTEPFSTRVRVRSAARRAGPIEVVVLDPRGDTVMTAAGTLSFGAARGDVTEYVVDWDPSPCRGPGAFHVLVRVAGEPLGTFPLEVVAAGGP